MTHIEKVYYINYIVCLLLYIIGAAIIWVVSGPLLLVGILVLLWGNNIQINMQRKEEEWKRLDREFMDKRLDILKKRVTEELKILKGTK